MDVVVHDAELVNWYSIPMWFATTEYQPDEGETKRLTYMFQHDMFETIVAEYDVDPQDWDTLFLIHFFRPELAHETEDEALTIYNAPTIQHAREHHLERIHEVRNGGSVIGVPGEPQFPVRAAAMNSVPLLVSAGSDDPLDTLRIESVISHPHIQAKREFRDGHRAERHVRLAELAKSRRLMDPSMTAVPERETPEEYLTRMRGPRPGVRLTDEERAQ